LKLQLLLPTLNFMVVFVICQLLTGGGSSMLAAAHVATHAYLCRVLLHMLILCTWYRMLLHMLMYAACCACCYACACALCSACSCARFSAPGSNKQRQHTQLACKRQCAENMRSMQHAGGATQSCFKTGHPLVWKLSCGKRSPHHSQHTPEKHGDNRNEVWRRKILEHISNIMLWIQTSFRLSPLQPHVSLQDSIGQYAGVFQFHAWIH
jgi:hypothetical protein